MTEPTDVVLSNNDRHQAEEIEHLKDLLGKAHALNRIRAERIKELEQSGVEPVAWGMKRPDGLILDVICPDEHESYEGEYTIPLYTHPPAPRVALTDGELRNISKQQDPVVPLHHNVLAFAHAIIAAYEAKNGIGGGK